MMIKPVRSFWRIFLDEAFIQNAKSFYYIFPILTKEFSDLHRIDELKNFAANFFFKLVSKSHIENHASNWLVSYWDLCIKKERLSLRNKSNWVLG